MRNFLKIAEGIDIIPLLHAVQNHPELWDKENTFRNDFENSPHKETQSIWLRYNDLTEYYADGCLDCAIEDLEAINYSAWELLPEARQIIFNLMRRVEGQRLGRVIITKLPAGKTITPHADTRGAYAEYYTRYHLPLQNLPGSIFKADDEQVYMRHGECWWFRHEATHEVINNSADDRIVLIVDIRV